MAASGNTYRIINVEHSNSAVDLIRGNPYGTVSGYTKNDGPVQKWRTVKLDNPNRFLLQSDFARGSYASVYYQVDGAPLSGSKNPTIWVLEWVPSSNAYRIKTDDGQYAWFLPGHYDFLTIILKPADDVADNAGALWTFESV